MNKMFLMSRGEFLGYATTKFCNGTTYSLNKRRLALMHIRVPTTVDYSTTSLYEQRQHEVEAKEFRAELRKLQNDLGKLYGILWDQCDSGMKNKIQSNVDYAEVSKMLNVLGLITIIERIFLFSDTSKYYVLQGFIAEKRLLNFRQINGISLANYHKEFEMLARMAHEAGADYVTMERMECERKRVYPLIPIGHFTDRQKGVIHKKIWERYMAIVFVINSNQNKYGQYKEIVITTTTARMTINDQHQSLKHMTS